MTCFSTMAKSLLLFLLVLCVSVRSSKFGLSVEELDSLLLDEEETMYNIKLVENETQIEETIAETTVVENSTVLETNAEATNETKKFVTCKTMLQNATAELRLQHTVEIINVSRLAEILLPDTEVTNRESEAQCTVVLFHSRHCPFSSLAAPHFNALARSFPALKVGAIDSIKHNRVNTQYGIVGIPSIILFHNGRAVAKFNGSEYSLQAFAKFIRTYTGIEEETVVLNSEDFQGPVPSVVEEETDYILILAWIFVLIVTLYYLSGTQFWKTIVETIKNTWREAEAVQHEHAE